MPAEQPLAKETSSWEVQNSCWPSSILWCQRSRAAVVSRLGTFPDPWRLCLKTLAVERETQTEPCGGNRCHVNSTFPLFLCFILGLLRREWKMQRQRRGMKEGEEKAGRQQVYTRRLAVRWIFLTKQGGTLSVNSASSQKTSPHAASVPLPLHFSFCHLKSLWF